MNNESDSHETASCKDILAHLAQLGPIDMLLGSVSYNEMDSGKFQQLRTSARVFKKMKFDQSIAAMPDKKDAKDEIKTEEPPKPEVKRTPNPEWSSEERNVFFEAVNEFGKDFESIHLYVSGKLKKKGVPEDCIKNKYQVRNFYYKIVHMLEKSLKFSDRIPKNAQELYTLINYGEMRKKVGSVSKKNWTKLNELVHKGSVAIRIKGKTIRIKTPMCRALRRLNQLDEKYDDLKLPTRVFVELKPKNMVSFLRVQSMAQNPRIRVAVPLQKRLSSLITCISTRWRSSEAVVYDKAVIPQNAVTKDCVPDPKQIEANSLLLTPLLRLTPPPDANIELPSIDISEYFTGQSICLTAFETRKGVKLKPAEEVKKEDVTDSAAKTDKSPAKDEDGSIIKDEKFENSVDKVVDDVVNNILSLKAQDVPVKNLKKEEPPVDPIILENKRQHADQVKKGWTLENCEALTIGEIYLMFGSDSEVQLEYSWDSLECKRELKDPVEDAVVEKPVPENALTQSLRKLLSLAKLQSSTNLVKCTCGHVCGAKNPVQDGKFKKPLSTKVLKKNQASQEAKHSESTTNEAPPDDDLKSSAAKTNGDHLVDPLYQKPNNTMMHIYNQISSLQRQNHRSGNKWRSRLVVERNLVPSNCEKDHQIVSVDIIQQQIRPNSATKDDKSGEIEGSSPSTSGTQPSLPNNNNDVTFRDTQDIQGKYNDVLDDQHSNSSLSAGIAKILKEHEHEWYDSDVADYSLSSLLGQLDCTMQTNQSIIGLPSDDTQLSQDVNAHVHTLLTETSLDFATKFADLAAQVNHK